jgi:Uma2 family endonuclease
MSSVPREPSTLGEPVWEIAQIFPEQGAWSESAYLALDTNRLIEFDHGILEFLPMPRLLHQLIARFLFRLLDDYVTTRGRGTTLFAPYKLRVGLGKYREPDLLVLLDENDPRMGDDFPDYADLVVVVVSDSNRDHDWITKRAEYARAGIPEYWIVDPEAAQVAVLRLDGDTYVEHGLFTPGQRATSALLAGFDVDAATTLNPPRH